MALHPDLAATFDAILRDVFRQTDASRTTIRLDLPELGMSLASPIAEIRGPGVRSLIGEVSVNQRSSAAVRWLDRERRVFVMNDCLAPEDPETAPGQEVLDIYGLRAEMVAPIIRDGQLIGCLSAHDTRGPRHWSPEEVRVMEEGVRLVLHAVAHFGRPT
jgi:maleate isomerase